MIRPSLLCAALSLALLPLVSSSSAAQDTTQLPWLSVTELQQSMDAGKLNTKTLVRDDLTRIHRIDQTGPALHSVLELNIDASKLAVQIDAKRTQSHGPLYGIPILLKDNIDTGDRTLTTAGSLALVEAPAPKDAALVTRLRNAGDADSRQDQSQRMGRLPLQPRQQRLDRSSVGRRAIRMRWIAIRADRAPVRQRCGGRRHSSPWRSAPKPMARSFAPPR
jgi:hypothetical protein